MSDGVWVSIWTGKDMSRTISNGGNNVPDAFGDLWDVHVVVGHRKRTQAYTGCVRCRYRDFCLGHAGEA